MQNVTEGSPHISVKTIFHITEYHYFYTPGLMFKYKLSAIQMPRLKVNIWSSLSAYSLEKCSAFTLLQLNSTLPPYPALQQ